MLDKTLPRNINVEPHKCGRQLGYTLTGVTRTWYDLQDREVVTDCPECGELLPSAHGRFDTEKSSSSLPTL